MCLGECTLSDLTAFVDRLDLVGSRATEISHIRSFYRWAVLDGKMDTNPAMRLLRPKVPRRLPRPISNEDLAMALTMAPTFEHSILMLAAYAGLRACEICQLRARSVLWTNVPRMIVIDEGKGGHEGAVPLHPVLEPVVRSLPNRGWLYPRRDGKPGHMSRHSISGYANRYLHSIGIDGTLHTLRHWFGTHVNQVNAGDVRESQELLRHQSLESTMIYTWVNPHRAAATIAALPTFT